MSPPQLPNSPEWPDPPNEPATAEADFAKLYYQARIDEVKARYEAEIDEVKARWRDTATHEDNLIAAEDKLREAVHSAYLEVAKGALDRSIQRANFVTAVAGAIGTSYTALLALVYSVSANTPNPMPVRGIYPAIFFGLALLLSTFYVAYIRAGTQRGHYIPKGEGPHLQERRMLFFVEWVMGSVTRRVWALRMSIVSLGIGLALNPLPFLEVPNPSVVPVLLVGLGIVIGALLLEFALYSFGRPQRSNN